MTEPVRLPPPSARDGRPVADDDEEGRSRRAVHRGIWLLLCAASIVLLLTARALTPAVSGQGTHTQLGLPPCGFHFLTSVPCPACGLTTAFAHMAHLQPWEALRAHPLGVVLFALAVAAVPLTLLGFARAWPPGETFERLRLERWVLATALAAIAVWLARVAGALI
jgi:hypothetical protein